MFSELKHRLDIPKEAAYPYLDSICKNLIEDYKRALTGPLIRKDIITIKRNLGALATDSFLPIYEAFLGENG